MKFALKLIAALLGLTLLATLGAGTWYLYSKQPKRAGSVNMERLSAPVKVLYDERGVPHITAENEADLYRALGYVHAQDRLFQMEMVRRLAKGELAEILGPKLLETDKLFRTLGIRHHAEQAAAALDPKKPANQALLAYLDGINQYQNGHKPPMEFDILGIPKRPFTPEDTIAVAGYLAFSFAQAFKTDPVLTYVRDKLGSEYLRAFDTEWHPEGVITPLAAMDPPAGTALALQKADYQALASVGREAINAMESIGVPGFEGSNAWAISGKRTASGKPLLAGDPHIGFSAPSVWYEAHLTAPGFDLYGHYQALNPMALLGHNAEFGWSLTMFQNDDIDLIAEKTNPENPNQVWYHDQWVDMKGRTEAIEVKGRDTVNIRLRSSNHGPIVNDAFKATLGRTPVAMWWAYLETENPVLDAFYELNRANTLEKAREAATKIHAPGLNIVWASGSGDIGWWAAAKLPLRPLNVNPTFILDGSKSEADKNGFYAFNFNPQEENPARGYIISANHQPKPATGVPVPGYYNLPDRARRLDAVVSNPKIRWDVAAAQSLQLDGRTGYAPRVLKDLLPIMEQVITDANEKAFMEPLTKWDGDYSRDSIAATLFTQMLYELSKAAFYDELGDDLFESLLQTRALDAAIPILVADAKSPWWDNLDTQPVESRFETVRVAWSNTVKHLQEQYGTSLLNWTWGKTHTLTHGHPLGRQKPLDMLFDVGPFPVAGGRETPNNLGYDIGPAPWKVSTGPSTRRIIDFAEPDQAVGINPVGQSGVLFDKHYADQAERYSEGIYVPQHLTDADVRANTKSRLTLRPIE